MSSVQRRVVFRCEALAQLEELEDFVVAAGSPVAAVDLVDALVAFCEDLAPFPLRGTDRDDIRPGVRTIGFRRRAVVAFAVREDSLVILGVYYGGRDYEPILRSQDWSD
ncbi:MAG: type II toxin-antitoxin system RelE/ParE family toxin [Cellulomonas sp.]